MPADELGDLPAEAPAPLVIGAPGVYADPGVDIIPATDGKVSAPEETPSNPVIMVPSNDELEGALPATFPPTAAETPFEDDTKDAESPEIAPAFGPGPTSDNGEIKAPSEGGAPVPPLENGDKAESPTEAPGSDPQPQGNPRGVGAPGDVGEQPGAPQPAAGAGSDVPGGGAPPIAAPGPARHRKASAPGPSGRLWWVGSGLPERTGGWRERLKEEHPVPAPAPSSALSVCADVAAPNMLLTCSQQVRNLLET